MNRLALLLLVVFTGAQAQDRDQLIAELTAEISADGNRALRVMRHELQQNLRRMQPPALPAPALPLDPWAAAEAAPPRLVMSPRCEKLAHCAP